MEDLAHQHTPHELEVQSTDQTQYPYIKMRGVLGLGADGNTSWNKATLAKVHDVDPSSTIEYATGVSPRTDWGLEVLKGKIPGHKIVTVYGRNPDNDAASGFETVWNGGGIYTGQNATAAEVVEIFSSSNNDGAGANTGARTVRFTGLNGSGAITSENVTLTGTTPVNTANSYKRFIRLEVLTAGAGLANIGTLTSRQVTTIANIFCVVPIGQNHSAVGAYTIPTGYTGYLKSWNFAVSGGVASPVAEFRLMFRQPGEVWQVNDTGASAKAGSNFNTRDFAYFADEPLLAGCDIRIDGDTDQNDTILIAGFDLVLVGS